MDMFTIEIVKASLGAIGEEMFQAQRRSSMSPIIYEALDFGVGVMDAHGRLVAQGNGIPGFVGTLDSAVRAVIDKHGAGEGVHDGDIFVTNDPYDGGGTHLSDITLVKPVFDRADLVAWVASKAHCTEIGGKDPGSFSADSVDVFQEGLQLPNIKLFVGGVPQRGLLDLIAANVRLPEMTLGDIWAGIAALRVGESRLLDLVRRHGRAVVEAAVEALLEQSARLTRERYARLPRGEFQAQEWVDDDGLGNGPFRVHARVVISDDAFLVDYSGSDPQAPGAVNNTASGLLSAVRQVFLSIVDPSLPVNDGCFRLIRVVCPDGSICKVRRPAPVSSYYETMIAATDVVWRALAEAGFDELPAGQFGSICSVVLSGRHPGNGEAYILVEPLAGGWGAGADRDGESGQFCVGNGETSNIPVEIVEARYGVAVRRYEFCSGITGAGRFRGGRGIVLEYEVVAPDGLRFSSMFGRTRTPAWGMRGGAEGSCNRVEILRRDGSIETYGKCNGVMVLQGESIRLVTGSGGGWGPAAERDPQCVQRDLEDGFLGLAEARAAYAGQLEALQRCGLLEPQETSGPGAA